MRLFIATTFAESVTRDIALRVATIKSKLPPASWVRPESQHLTFAFLGEQDEAIVDKLAPAIEARLDGTRKFSATLHGCGFFPNPRHARVGWVGLEPEEPFKEIAAIVRDVAKHSGVELDGSEFRPHLTLMRMREGWPPASIELFTRTLKDYRSAPVVIDAITLYSSRLNPSGAIHTPVRKFELA